MDCDRSNGRRGHRLATDAGVRSPSAHRQGHKRPAHCCRRRSQVGRLGRRSAGGDTGRRRFGGWNVELLPDQQTVCPGVIGGANLFDGRAILFGNLGQRVAADDDIAPSDALPGAGDGVVAKDLQLAPTCNFVESTPGLALEMAAMETPWSLAIL